MRWLFGVGRSISFEEWDDLDRAVHDRFAPLRLTQSGAVNSWHWRIWNLPADPENVLAEAHMHANSKWHLRYSPEGKKIGTRAKGEPMSKQKNVGLILREEGPEWQRTITKIFEGTEHLVRRPQYNFKDPYYGIDSFGTVKVKGREDVICYRASIDQTKRLEECGWKVVGQGLHYCYVTRGERREQS